MEMFLPLNKRIVSFVLSNSTCLFPRKRTRHQRTFQFPGKIRLSAQPPGEQKHASPPKVKILPDVALSFSMSSPMHVRPREKPHQRILMALPSLHRQKQGVTRIDAFVGIEMTRQTTGSARIRARVVITLSRYGRTPPCNEFLFFLALPMLVVKVSPQLQYLYCPYTRYSSPQLQTRDAFSRHPPAHRDMHPLVANARYGITKHKPTVSLPEERINNILCAPATFHLFAAVRRATHRRHEQANTVLQVQLDGSSASEIASNTLFCYCRLLQLLLCISQVCQASFGPVTTINCRAFNTMLHYQSNDQPGYISSLTRKADRRWPQGTVTSSSTTKTASVAKSGGGMNLRVEHQVGY